MTSNEDDADGLESVSSTPGAQRSVAANVGALMTSQVATWTLSTVLVWIVPRYLGPEAFGSLRLATALWLIASVFAAFGTSALLTVEIARRPDTFKSILANSLKLRFGLAAVVAPIVITILIFGPYDSQTRQVAIIVGIGTAVAMGVNALEAALFGLQEMGEPARIRVIAKTFTTVTTIVVVLLGGRLLSVATATLIGAVLSAGLFFRAVNSKGANLTATSTLAGTGLFVASLPFFAAQASRVIYQQIDTVVISALVDPEAVGWYAAADTLFGSLLFVPAIVATAMFPAIAQLHERSPNEVPQLLGQSFNTLLLVSMPIGLGTVVVAPSFVRLLYGQDFSGAAPVLAVYGVVVTLSSLTILLGRFALATGRAAFWSSLMIAVTVLSIPLDIVLVPWTDQRFDNGAIGGALAYVVTEGLLIVIGLAVVGRGALTASSFKRLVRCLVAGAAMLAASWSFRDEFFAIPGAIAVATYALVIILLRTMDPHEIVLLSQVRDQTTVPPQRHFIAMTAITKGFVGAIGAAASTLSIVVAGCASYLSVLTVAAVASSRRVRRDLPDDRLDTRRFVVFVPAHNEAQVIERSVSALLALDYPPDEFSVHVVADNCTDETAEIVRRVGARVHERADADQPGKGHALNWLFDQVSALETFDAVVIVDADTVVDPSFLSEIDKAMAQGSVVVQGRYDVIEASASTAASIRAAALACRHHLRPMGRNALSGSSGLYGNGMAFHHSILRDRKWSGHLVEDAEFQNELLLDGLCVDYVPGARLFAEMPDTFDASVTQNERWELGRLQVARRYVPSLLRLATTGERNLRIARLDAVADHIVPPMSILVTANGLAGVFAAAAALLRGSAGDRRAVVASLASAVAIVAHVLTALRMAGAPRSTYQALAAAPRAIAWKVTLWVRVLVRGESVDWVRTQRNEKDPQSPS